MSVLAYTDVLDAFAQKLELDDVTLLMHDLGGTVALSYAARHPDRISSLVVSQWRQGLIVARKGRPTA